MNILVCIKPDISGKEIGPFEALALEAALCLKDRQAAERAIRVDVMTAGPPEWNDILRRALGMGADNGFHILTRADTAPDALVPASVTAALLARAVLHSHTPPYDIVLTGVMSQDLMAGQTGPMLAEYLDYTLATAVVGILSGGKKLEARREWEGGIRETLEIPLPALMSIQAGEYTPRYPSLSNMLKAKSKTIHTMTPEDLGLEPAKPHPHEFFLHTAVPEKTRAGQVVSGSIPDQVRVFKTFLKERALV